VSAIHILHSMHRSLLETVHDCWANLHFLFRALILLTGVAAISLLSSLARQGQDKTLLEICAIYLPFESANPVLITHLAYLACLSQLLEPKTVVVAMKHLATASPKDVPIQCVLATAYLCDGQHARAAATLDRLQLDPTKLSPGYQAAFLTIQACNDRIAMDDARITGMPWKSLLPSEREKFGELLRAAQP
jgi:hypothetical protein